MHRVVQRTETDMVCSESIRRSMATLKRTFLVSDTKCSFCYYLFIRFISCFSFRTQGSTLPSIFLLNIMSDIQMRGRVTDEKSTKEVLCLSRELNVVFLVFVQHLKYYTILVFPIGTSFILLFCVN